MIPQVFPEYVPRSESFETYQRLCRARKFMDEHYTHPIDLNQISRQAYFSPFHFLRLFKDTFGKTPHQYLMQRRIEMARRYLTRTELSVTEICFMVGFQSLGSFSSLFRKVVGTSPSLYRMRFQERKERMAKNPELAVPACFLSMYGMLPRRK